MPVPLLLRRLGKGRQRSPGHFCGTLSSLDMERVIGSGGEGGWLAEFSGGAAEGESVPGPILEIGNAEGNTREEHHGKSTHILVSVCFVPPGSAV
jgi:hypothetical protein